MASDFSSILGSLSKGTGTTIQVVMIALIVIFVMLAVIGGLFFIFWNKKRYNLNVEIKKTRSDGKITTSEWGKGLYSAKRGVVYIKRKKLKRIPMKIFDIRRYLQGEDTITVIQVGVEDFRPVLNNSWTKHEVTYVNEKGQEISQKEAVLNIKVDTGLNKAWKSSFEAAAKKAYSLQSLLNQFQVPISIAIVVISVFVGVAILWTKIGSMCGH